MFSKEPRRRFAKNQLIEVICQLRFPEILTIGANLPVDFQERIRGEFPHYSARREAPPPKLIGTPGSMAVENQQPTINYQFVSEDQMWRVNLTSKFISLSCRRYTSWEEFAQKLDLPLAAFIQIYNPAFFERVGLRYINAFSRKDLGVAECPFRDLIQPCYLGILASEEIRETSTTRSSYDMEMRLRGDSAVRLHAGPGLLQKPGQPKDTEVKFILDLDLYMTAKTPIHLTASAMDALHQQADSLFLGAITEDLKDAMEPREFL